MTSAGSTIPKRVRQRRVMLGITQKTVATLLAIDRSTLYRWEHTTKIPEYALSQLAALYRCTVDEFRMPASAPWADTPSPASVHDELVRLSATVMSRSPAFAGDHPLPLRPRRE